MAGLRLNDGERRSDLRVIRAKGMPQIVKAEARDAGRFGERSPSGAPTLRRLGRIVPAPASPVIAVTALLAIRPGTMNSIPSELTERTLGISSIFTRRLFSAGRCWALACPPIGVPPPSPIIRAASGAYGYGAHVHAAIASKFVMTVMRLAS